MSTEPVGVFSDLSEPDEVSALDIEDLDAEAWRIVDELSYRIAVCMARNVPEQVVTEEGWAPNASPIQIRNRLTDPVEADPNSARMIESLRTFSERGDTQAEGLARELSDFRAFVGFDGPDEDEPQKGPEAPEVPGETEAAAPVKVARFMISSKYVHPIPNGTKARVVLPKGVSINGLSLGGYSMIVNIGAKARQEILDGKMVHLAIAADRQKDLRKGRGEDTEELSVNPWKLVSAIKRDRERYYEAKKEQSVKQPERPDGAARQAEQEER